MKQMDNRQLIIEKALELFCARGYDAVGVQEIAEQSGITKPTLYYYFGSKQGLMETILKENSHILEEMLIIQNILIRLLHISISCVKISSIRQNLRHLRN